MSLQSFSKKICGSVRWVTLWARPPPPVKICVSVRWGKLWVRPPLCENMCVRSLGYIVGASPPLCVCHLVILCVSFHWKTIFVRSLHAAYSALHHFLYINRWLVISNCSVFCLPVCRKDNWSKGIYGRKCDVCSINQWCVFSKLVVCPIMTKSPKFPEITV